LFVHVAWRVVSGVSTVGDLVIFGTATTRLRITLEGFVALTSEAMQGTLHISNIREFLAAHPPAAPAAVVAFGPTSRAAIDVRDVHFTYPGSSASALNGVS